MRSVRDDAVARAEKVEELRGSAFRWSSKHLLLLLLLCCCERELQLLKDKDINHACMAYSEDYLSC